MKRIHGRVSDPPDLHFHPLHDTFSECPVTAPEDLPLAVAPLGRPARFAHRDDEHAGLEPDRDAVVGEGHSGQLRPALEHPGEGVGRRAAELAIRERPGRWEIAVARRNTPAQPFWRGVAARLAAGAIEELDQDDDNWNGLILRFHVA